MQEQFIYFPKDHSPPSAEERRKFLSVDNPGGPYYGFRGNSEALSQLQAIAFDALGKYHHVTSHVHVAFVGLDSIAKTDLVHRHNKARMLPLVEISSGAVKTAHDVS